MMRPTLLFAFLIAFFAGRPAQAQCADSRSTSAFNSALGRLPTAAECQTYAGFAYQAVAAPSVPHSIADYQTASSVCQDPWIAQAYLYLGLNLNGHSPLQMDGSGPRSTMNGCNYTTYGSWANFPALVALVKNHIAPTVSAPVSSSTATINGPPLWLTGQPATVTWTATQQGAPCASGVRVVLNNSIQYGSPVMLATGRITVPATTYPPNTQVSLALQDLCTGQVISNRFSTTIGSSSPPVQTVQAPASSALRMTPGSTVLQVNGAILSPTILGSGGSLLVVTPSGIVAQGGGNYVDSQTGLLMGSNGAPLLVSYGVVSNDGGSIVAQGGGNIVAQGGGNIVAQGGGNIVAQGGGNIVAQGGGNLLASVGNFQLYNSAFIASLIQQVAAGNMVRTQTQLAQSTVAGLTNNVANMTNTSGSNMYNIQSVGGAAQTTSSAVITGPNAWVAGQPATVTWNATQSGQACSSGVRVVMNGNIQTGSAVMLSAGRVTIPATTYPANSAVTLSLMDLCTGRLISSAAYSVRISAAPAAIAMPATTAPSQAALTGPSTWAARQPATVTWRVVQQGAACASGVRVVLNGNIQTGAAVALAAGSVVIPATTYPSNSTITLALMDLCSGRLISPSVSLKIK